MVLLIQSKEMSLMAPRFEFSWIMVSFTNNAPWPFKQSRCKYIQNQVTLSYLQKRAYILHKEMELHRLCNFLQKSTRVWDENSFTNSRLQNSLTKWFMSGYNVAIRDTEVHRNLIGQSNVTGHMPFGKAFVKLSVNTNTSLNEVLNSFTCIAFRLVSTQ